MDHQVTEIVDDLRFIQERFFSRSTSELVELADRIANVFRDGGKLFVFGTGPSNLIARILVDALVHRIAVKRPPMAALALGTDTALMSGMGEQESLDEVMARQLVSLAGKDDMALAFSADGESPATIKALMAAREAGLPTAAFLGRDGGHMRNYADQALVVEAEHPGRIHEVHLIAAQILAQLIERQLFPL